MRKIEQQVIGAFLNGKSLRVSNTSSIAKPIAGHPSLWLHGHCIARRTKRGLEVNFCGWVTPTTQSRLNSLCELIGLGRPFTIRKGQVRFHGLPIDSDRFYSLMELNRLWSAHPNNKKAQHNAARESIGD